MKNESKTVKSDVDSTDKMVVIVFADEKHAYEGSKALNDLHGEGSLTLYGSAIVAKNGDGKVTVKQAADEGPLGTAVGLATGTLIGLLGGPVGVVIGATTGTLAGSVYDVAQLGVGEQFLTEAAQALSPGKVAVIAEVEEEWVTPLDTRMETLEGTVIRQPRAEFLDAQIERETAARKAELARLKAERDHAVGAAKAKLQAKVQAAQQALREESARLKEKIAATERERKAKIATIKAQAAHARGEFKEKIQKRIADSQARHQARKEKLSQAWELVKEAAAI